MRIIGDLHSHSIASVHAYNTIFENLARAKELGYKVLAITDHGIAVKPSAPLKYFENLVALPREYNGVTLLRGVEANIMDYDGTLDMPEDMMDLLDIVIASMHVGCIVPGTVEDHTRAYLKVAENPYVKIIGHSGTACFKYDYEKVIPVFKEYGKVVEMNTHSFICRKDSIPNCRRIMELCKKYDEPILVNSDAHVITEMGLNDGALAMLEELDFPERLVLNADEDRLREYIRSIGVTDADD